MCFLLKYLRNTHTPPLLTVCSKIQRTTSFGFFSPMGGRLVIQLNNYGTYLKKVERSEPVFHKLQIYFVEKIKFETRQFQFPSEGVRSRRSVNAFSVSLRQFNSYFEHPHPLHKPSTENNICHTFFLEKGALCKQTFLIHHTFGKLVLFFWGHALFLRDPIFQMPFG